MPTASEPVTIRIDRRTAAALEAKATARGLSLESYLRTLAENGDESRSELQKVGAAAAGEFDRALDEFFEQNPRKLPPLPADFSRADIYNDHD